MQSPGVYDRILNDIIGTTCMQQRECFHETYYAVSECLDIGMTSNIDIQCHMKIV